MDAPAVTRRETKTGWFEVSERRPARALRAHVSSYYGFREQTREPLRRREGPGTDIVLVISFGDEWVIDGERFTSFAAGLHERQVTTEQLGRADGMQINVSPPAAFMLFGLPLHELAHREVALEDVLGEPDLVERLHDAPGWQERFELLDAVLARRLADARHPAAGVVWAWRRLVEAHGAVPVGSLADELGWSRRRLVARFLEQIGLPPKAAARVLRFEHARGLAERERRPDWARIAVDAGYYDQSHLINEFRRITGRTPVTFFQDTAAPAA